MYWVGLETAHHEVSTRSVHGKVPYHLPLLPPTAMYMIWRGTRCGAWAMLRQLVNVLWCTRHAHSTQYAGPFQGSRRPMLGGPNPLFPLSGPAGGNLQGVVQLGGRLRVNPGGCRAGIGGAMFGHYKDLMVKSGAYQASRGVFRVLCMEADSSISHFFFFFV